MCIFIDLNTFLLKMLVTRFGDDFFRNSHNQNSDQLRDWHLVVTKYRSLHMYIRFEENSVMEESSQSDTIYFKFASLSRGHFWEKNDRVIRRCDFMSIYDKIAHFDCYKWVWHIENYSISYGLTDNGPFILYMKSCIYIYMNRDIQMLLQINEFKQIM